MPIPELPPIEMPTLVFPEISFPNMATDYTGLIIGGVFALVAIGLTLWGIFAK